MSAIVARTALTVDGWRDGVAVTLDGSRIAAVTPTDAPATVDILLPAPGNLHSHAFQRAMAGLTETGSGSDDFWSWRTLMFRFLEDLDPDDIEIIAAGVQMEMLEAGYAAIGEFHYVHNPPGGGTYDDIAELAVRIVAAASRTGIGLTNRIAVTVVAASSTVADSRATAIRVLGIKKGMDYANSKKFQVLILTMSNKKHRLLKSLQWKLW